MSLGFRGSWLICIAREQMVVAAAAHPTCMHTGVRTCTRERAGLGRGLPSRAGELSPRPPGHSSFLEAAGTHPLGTSAPLGLSGCKRPAACSAGELTGKVKKGRGSGQEGVSGHRNNSVLCKTWLLLQACVHGVVCTKAQTAQRQPPSETQSCCSLAVLQHRQEASLTHRAHAPWPSPRSVPSNVPNIIPPSAASEGNRAGRQRYELAVAFPAGVLQGRPLGAAPGSVNWGVTFAG